MADAPGAPDRAPPGRLTAPTWSADRDYGLPAPLPPPLRGLGGERAGPDVVLQCDDCGRRIPALDDHGVAQC
eukprot:13703623-Alexandrium_andersonii.AAC.1